MQERSSIVVEEYLQVIYSLRFENKTVKAVHLANRLETSPSTVHATLSRMQRDDFIEISPKKEIELTKTGMERAERLTRRHRLVEKFLCDTLGISWHEVHHHAHIMEHGLTPLVEEKLAEFLNFPKSCPHGTPIPGAGSPLPEGMIQLNECETGDSVEIVIVSEALEESLELMKFLQDKDIIPGKHHQVTEKTNITKTVGLTSDGLTSSIPFEIAEAIGVLVL